MLILVCFGDKMENKLTFTFCEQCGGLINGKCIQPLGFNGLHFCTKECWEKRDKKMREIFPFFNEKNIGDVISDDVGKLKEIYDRLSLSKLNAIDKNIRREEGILSSIKEDMSLLIGDKDKLEEEIKNLKIKVKIILSHKNKCGRCGIIDLKGKNMTIEPGNNEKTNKLFVCRECYPIVDRYIDNLKELYNDWDTIRAFVLSVREENEYPKGRLACE